MLSMGPRPVHQLLLGVDAQAVIDGHAQVFMFRASSSGSDAVASLEPRSGPLDAAALVRTTLKTFGQWSRPAVALIFGVRPNSDDTMISVESSWPVRSRSRTRAAKAWSRPAAGRSCCP